MERKFTPLNKPYYQPYRRYLPTAFDETPTMLEKVNKLIEFLNKVVEHTNNFTDFVEELLKTYGDFINENIGNMWESIEDLRNDWEEVKEWLLNQGLKEEVVNILNEWLNDGTIEDLVNDVMLTLLEAKLDKEYYERMASIKSFPKYGTIDFDLFKGLKHNINFDFWRDLDGNIKHNYKLDEKEFINFYVSDDGINSNDGASPDTPWKTLKYAINQIEQKTNVKKAKINLSGVLYRDSTNIDLNTTITKDYIITSEKPLGTNQRIDDWVNYQGNVYKATCNYEITGVVNINKKVQFDKYQELKKVNSLSECENTYNSYFYNMENIFVNTKEIGNNIFVLIPTQLFQVELSGGENQFFCIKDITFLNGGKAQPLYVKTKNSVVGEVVLLGVILQNFGYGVSMNGFMFDSVKDVKLFNCKGFNIPRDVFNYHNNNDTNIITTVLEYNCFGEHSGFMNNNTNDNISSAHDGIHVIRLGTKGINSSGPLIADVNGCYSLNIDVFVYNTNMDNLSSNVNSAFYFNDSPTTNITSPNGKAWLINCGGGSSSEWGINGDVSFKNKNKIFIDNFQGNKIPFDLDFVIFDYGKHKYE